MIAVLLARVYAALAARFQTPDCCPHPDLIPEENTDGRKEVA